MSLRNVVLMLGLGAAASLHAATEFENGLVPAELVREFAGGTVYKSLPDNFPAIPLPATVDLRLIGSMEQFSSQRLLLRTSLGVDAIRAQLRTALLGAGWVDLSIDPSPLSLCHDQHGSMQISTTDRGGDNRVHVSRSFWPLSIPRPGTQTCAEQLAARQGSGNWYTYYLNLLPVLQVPPQTISPTTPLRPFGSFASGTSSTGTTVDIDRDGIIVVPDITIPGLYAHFAARMTEQGWKNDSEDTGSKSAASVWYKTAAAPAFAAAADPIELTVTLTLQNTTGNNYRVQLRMQVLLPAGSGGGNIISVRDFGGLPLPLNDAALGIRGIPSNF